MKRTLLTATTLLIFFSPLFFGCRNDVTYETTEKEQKQTVYTTTQDASKINFYKQNKYGDTDLSSYELDSTSNSFAAKGTALSQLASKSYTGFSYATAIQVNSVVNVYYNRNAVTYEFYPSHNDTTPTYKISGLYGADVTAPSFTPPSDYYFSLWEEANGTHLGATFGAEGKKYYPVLLLKTGIVGTKATVDTIGDVLLDDGSVISCTDLGKLVTDGKTAEIANIKQHAYGVLICDNYKTTVCFAGLAPNDNISKTSMLQQLATNADYQKKLFSGSQKLVAGLFKDDIYRNTFWMTINNSAQQYPIALIDYVDGKANLTTLSNLIRSKENGNEPTTDSNVGINAFSACASYGNRYCRDTAYADDWYLPALAELYVFFKFLSDETYKAVTEQIYGCTTTGSGADYKVTSGLSLWSSNTDPSHDTIVWGAYFKGDGTVPFYERTRYKASDSQKEAPVPFRRIN